MPIDYGYEFDPYECAYCGAPREPRKWDDHVRAWSRGGIFTIPCCRECNLSKHSKGIKAWLRDVRDYWPDKWEDILYHHRWRHNWLSQLVHEIRDEW